MTFDATAPGRQWGIRHTGAGQGWPSGHIFGPFEEGEALEILTGLTEPQHYELVARDVPAFQSAGAGVSDCMYCRGGCRCDDITNPADTDYLAHASLKEN